MLFTATSFSFSSQRTHPAAKPSIAAELPLVMVLPQACGFVTMNHCSGGTDAPRKHAASTQSQRTTGRRTQDEGCAIEGHSSEECHRARREDHEDCRSKKEICISDGRRGKPRLYLSPFSPRACPSDHR